MARIAKEVYLKMYEPQIIIGKDFLDKVTPHIVAARYSIEIIIYDWRLRPTQPDHPVSLLVRELQRAATRGVRIRALVGSAAVREGLRFTGIDTKVLHSDKLMHAKMMLIDSQIAVIGSHNYTHSAFTKNLEISVVVSLPQGDNDLTSYFNNLWSV